MEQFNNSPSRQSIDGPRLAVFDPEAVSAKRGETPDLTPAPEQKAKGRGNKKPRKPDKDFPLWLHPSGRWCRKIRQKVYYFGKADDPDGALLKWLEQKDDLLAGRTPRPKSDGLLLGDLAERFLNSKRALVESGELSPRTLGQYHSTCRKLVAQFGKNRRVDDLDSDDFAAFRAEVAKTNGLVGIANEIRLVRMVFKHGYDAGLIPAPVRFGSAFKVRQSAIRKDAAGKAPRMFEAADIRKLLAKADDTLKAMILLALNCAFGQTDLSDLPQTALDLEHGWVTFPRVKTGVERKAALWPETVKAVRLAIAERPQPKDAMDAGCVFITKYGNRWTRTSDKGGSIDGISQEFGKLLVALDLKRPGLQFYALRHTFRTIADSTRDFPAIDRIMGHADHTMGGRYRERIDDERLKAVSDHVRLWVFPPKRKTK